MPTNFECRVLARTGASSFEFAPGDLGQPVVEMIFITGIAGNTRDAEKSVLHWLEVFEGRSSSSSFGCEKIYGGCTSSGRFGATAGSLRWNFDQDGFIVRWFRGEEISVY